MLAVVVLISITSIAQTKDNMGKKAMKAASMTQATPNIVGVAVSNKNFTTLVAAVKAAGLVETPIWSLFLFRKAVSYSMR